MADDWDGVTDRRRGGEGKDPDEAQWHRLRAVVRSEFRSLLSELEDDEDPEDDDEDEEEDERAAPAGRSNRGRGAGGEAPRAPRRKAASRQAARPQAPSGGAFFSFLVGKPRN